MQGLLWPVSLSSKSLDISRCASQNCYEKVTSKMIHIIKNIFLPDMKPLFVCRQKRATGVTHSCTSAWRNPLDYVRVYVKRVAGVFFWRVRKDACSICSFWGGNKEKKPTIFIKQEYQRTLRGGRGIRSSVHHSNLHFHSDGSNINQSTCVKGEMIIGMT